MEIKRQRGNNLRNSRVRHPRKEARRTRAAERAAAGATRTPSDRLAALDARFGPGCGATRERARLMALIKNGKK